jgi:catechol 2,3-dioxygenase-like lactoylglutathione lyase family enzyme
MSASVRHTGIVVSDVDSWVEFLTSFFDFQVWIDQLEKGEFISHLLGIQDAEVRTLKLRDAKGGTIELLDFKKPKKTIQEANELAPNSMGITHIALEVEHLNSKLENLQAKGYYPIAPAWVSEDGKARVCYLRGPERILFELVEIIG